MKDLLKDLLYIYQPQTELEKEIIKHIYQIYGFQYTKEYLRKINYLRGKENDKKISK